MELTRKKLIILSAIGIIVLLVLAFLLLQGGKETDGDADGKILTMEPSKEDYTVDNRGKQPAEANHAATGNSGGAANVGGASVSPLQGGMASSAQPDVNYSHPAASQASPSTDRRTGRIGGMDVMGEDELDRIQREIEEDNRSYAHRQQQHDDSLAQANIDRGVSTLTGKAARQKNAIAGMGKVSEGDVSDGYGGSGSSSSSSSTKAKSKKNGKKKVDDMKSEEKKAASSGRFSDVTIQKKAKTNAIKAYVHSQQVVRQGSTLKMRVAEDCLTDDGHLLARNSFVYGVVKKIDGERVDVEISNVNINGNILPFNKIVYSRDAQRGIRVTNTAKSEAAKQAAGDAVEGATVSTGMATGGIIGAGVGLVQGALQGTKRVISKNVKDVKVTIKTNYELLFMEPEDDSSADDGDAAQ